MHIKKPVLILGIGNLLMGDEGLGVHFINRYQEECRGKADFLDGGTGGFHLMEYFEKYDHVIILDATLDDDQVGKIRMIKPRFASDYPAAMSTHDIGLKDLVSALQLLDRSPEIYLFVVGINRHQLQGIYLSDQISMVLTNLRDPILALADKITKKHMDLALSA